MFRLFLLLLSVQAIAAQQLDTSSCGTKKGCLFAPSGCKETNTCQMSFSYVVSGNDLILELEGKAPTNGYLAVGFSKDTEMGDDSVSACFSGQDFLGYNDGKTNSVVDAPGVHELQAYSASNGDAYCRIRRSIKGQNNPKIFDLDASQYIIFLAYGPVQGQGLGYHGQNKWTLPSTALTAYSTAGGFNPSTTPSSSLSSQSPVFSSSATLPSSSPPSPSPPLSTTAFIEPSTTPNNGKLSLLSLGCSLLTLLAVSLLL